jgi:hypothetical protein
MRRLTVALALIAVATACSQSPRLPQSSAAPQDATPAPKQTVLPFTGLERPDNVEVDSAGNVYLTDSTPGEDSNRVIELAADSKTQKTLSFTRSTLIAGPSGAVWVIDGGQRHSRLVKLAPPSVPQTALPLPDIGIRGQVLALAQIRQQFFRSMHWTIQSVWLSTTRETCTSSTAATTASSN